jgi:peptidoglycan/xylan/chitin deacetylase (PgdA/CDA1 family)
MGGALILGYHRISAAEDDVFQVCVYPDNFVAHMETLREYANPIRLSRLVQSLRQNSLQPKSVVVTFDDGYADNLYAAKPLLEKYEIPATVFICTGYIGQEFWWDELQRLIAGSQTDPRTLHLQAGGKQFEWHAKNQSSDVQKAASRQELLGALYQFLLRLDVEDQNRARESIRSWSGVASPGMSVPRAMSEEELLRLVDGGLIELGAHTRHHSMLPDLSLERQRQEIQSSKMDLENLLGRQIEGFAYPNGRSTPESKQLVREMGFSYACTSLHDVVGPRSDFYELTRFWQQDVDGEEFVKGLKRWMRMRTP